MPAQNSIVHRGEPGYAVGVVERDAVTDFFHIGLWMKIIRIGEPATELLGQQLSDGSLTRADYSHEDHDQASLPPCHSISDALIVSGVYGFETSVRVCLNFEVLSGVIVLVWICNELLGNIVLRPAIDGIMQLPQVIAYDVLDDLPGVGTSPLVRAIIHDGSFRVDRRD